MYLTVYCSFLCYIFILSVSKINPFHLFAFSAPHFLPSICLLFIYLKIEYVHLIPSLIKCNKMHLQQVDFVLKKERENNVHVMCN